MSLKTLTSILQSLNTTSLGIRASGVATKDGLIMAAVLPQDVDEDWLGAMSAAMSSLGDKAAEKLVRGRFEQLLIKSSTGDLLMVHAGTETVLSVVARPDAPMETLYQETIRAAKSIAEVVD
ncbi:MAG: hypothetical protein FIA97_14995 [Methylococcaceae bacterium]|nr:hypothetical protein [Methylococcaceae bacterium]